jgi:hypothetical protein
MVPSGKERHHLQTQQIYRIVSGQAVRSEAGFHRSEADGIQVPYALGLLEPVFAMEALRRTGVPVHFVCYEQLVSSPADCLNSISRFLDLLSPFDPGAAVAIPAQTLDASNDIDRASSPTIDRAPFDPARAELASALARMGWRNAGIILRDVDDDVLSATGRPGFRKTYRQALGPRAVLRSLVGIR